MWDKEYGGFYPWVNYRGGGGLDEVLSDHQRGDHIRRISHQTYALYALSQYHMTFNDTQVSDYGCYKRVVVVVVVVIVVVGGLFFMSDALSFLYFPHH